MSPFTHQFQDSTTTQKVSQKEGTHRTPFEEPCIICQLHNTFSNLLFRAKPVSKASSSPLRPFLALTFFSVSRPYTASDTIIAYLVLLREERFLGSFQAYFGHIKKSEKKKKISGVGWVWRVRRQRKKNPTSWGYLNVFRFFICKQTPVIFKREAEKKRLIRYIPSHGISNQCLKRDPSTQSEQCFLIHLCETLPYSGENVGNINQK